MTKNQKLKILVIHGPNLNLLGTREPDTYGTCTLSEINENLLQQAKANDVQIDIFQSNHEGAIVDVIQLSQDCQGVLINPAAYTHTSIAIRDALLATNIPFVEVHLSDISVRESFRKTSYLTDIALTMVSGKGPNSYYEGMDSLIKHLRGNKA